MHVWNGNMRPVTYRMSCSVASRSVGSVHPLCYYSRHFATTQDTLLLLKSLCYYSRHFATTQDTLLLLKTLCYYSSHFATTQDTLLLLKTLCCYSRHCQNSSSPAHCSVCQCWTLRLRSHCIRIWPIFYTGVHCRHRQRKQMRLNKWKRSQWCRAALTCTDTFRRLMVETKSFCFFRPCMPECRVVSCWTHVTLSCFVLNTCDTVLFASLNHL